MSKKRKKKPKSNKTEIEFTSLPDLSLRDLKSMTNEITFYWVRPKLTPNRSDASDAVKETRKMLRVSQAVFARLLGVSPQTIRAWEQGVSEPSNIGWRFIEEIQHNPDYWRKRLIDSIVESKKHITEEKADE